MLIYNITTTIYELSIGALEFEQLIMQKAFHSALLWQQQGVESAFVPFFLCICYGPFFFNSPFLCCVPDKIPVLIRK